jgi:GGDEF domain-containing protein
MHSLPRKFENVRRKSIVVHLEGGYFTMILERNLCPDIAEIKELMLKEVVQTPCSIHSGSKKIHVLKGKFCCNNLK